MAGPGRMDTCSERWDLRSRISFLLRRDTMSDVAFLVGDPPQRIPCHSLILGAGSPVFRTMFYGDLPEKGTVCVPDLTFGGFNAMLQYLYSDKVCFETENGAFDAAYAAKKYLLQDLFHKCENYVIANLRLSPENVCALYEEASLLEMRRLKETCLRYIAKNVTDVLNSESFLLVSKFTLEDILEQDLLEVPSECNLVEGLWRWGQQQCRLSEKDVTRTNVRRYVDDILKHVRLLSLRVDEFTELTKKCNMFDASEEMAILFNIALPRNCDAIKMPSNFSTSARRRSISNCNRIEIPLEYRFNDSNTLYSIPMERQLATIEVDKGQLTVLGIVLSFMPIAGYSSPHRSLDVGLLMENHTTGAQSSGQVCLKHDQGELNSELILEEAVVVSEGEVVTVTVILKGEGVHLPQLLQEEVSKCLDGKNVILTLPLPKGSRKAFAIKEIMCV